MKILPDLQLYGLKDFALDLPREKPGRKGLDAVRQRWQASSKDAYKQDERGRLSRFPGYSTMFIDDLECSEEIPGHAYEFDLKGTGLLNGRDKWIDGPHSQPEQGWDTASYTVYTRQPDLLKNGLVHPSIASLWVADHDKEREIGDIYRVELSYKGIIPVDGIAKPYKRQISVNSATLSTSEPLKVYVRQTSGNYVLNEQPRYYNLESPRIQVTDSFLSLTEPPTLGIPGNWIPPDAPEVRALLTSQAYEDPIVLAYINASIEQSINVPSGWVLKSIASEKLASANVWLTSLSAEYIRANEPRI